MAVSGNISGRERCPAVLRGSQCFLDVGHLGMHTTDLRGVLWRDGEEETPMVLVKLDVRTMQPALDDPQSEALRRRPDQEPK